MKTFHITMLRPDKVFYEGDVEAIIVNRPDGFVEIMANHMPMIMSLAPGMAKMRIENKIVPFATGDGMLQIAKDGCTITSDFLAWEDKLDAAIKNREENIHNELERRHKSFIEHKLSQMEIARIFASLDRLKKR